MWLLTGASSSSGKGLTAVSTVTWVRIPATGELTFRYRKGQMTDTWQHVTSLDQLCGVRILLYNSKKKIDVAIALLKFLKQDTFCLVYKLLGAW